MEAVSRTWLWCAFLASLVVPVALNLMGLVDWASAMWIQAIALSVVACAAIALWGVHRESSWLKLALVCGLWIVAFPGSWFAGSSWPLLVATPILLAWQILARRPSHRSSVT